MAIQMTPEQFEQLLTTLGQRTQRQPRHFTQCSAKFNGTRSASAVEEFITSATIYKTVEEISDKDALAGLPLLLTGEANQWWNGVKGNVTTWQEATELIRKAYAPSIPNHQIFAQLFNYSQPEDIAVDQFITTQRDRLARLSRQLDEEWQIDMIYGLLRKRIRDRVSREEVPTFELLLHKARLVEASERETQKPRPKQNEQKSTGTTNCSRLRTKCEYCRNFGHEQKDCRKRLRETTVRTAPAAATNATVPAENTTIRCYGCQKPGVFRRNCPNCNPSNSANAFCALNIHTISPRQRPAVSITIAGAQGTAYLDTAACNSVASASLYKHLLSTGHVPQEVTVEATLADGNVKTLRVPIIKTLVKIADRTIPTTFVALSDLDTTRTLLGADFLEDSHLIPDLTLKRFCFGNTPNQWLPFNKKLNQEPTDDDVQAIFNEMRLLNLIEPIEDPPGKDIQLNEIL